MAQAVGHIHRNIGGPADENLMLLRPQQQLGSRQPAKPVFHQFSGQLCLEIIGLLLVAGQQHYRLNMHQTRSHLKEFACNLEILIRAVLNKGEILAQQLGNFDIKDIQLMLGDQMQQQIERALEFRKPKGRLYHRSFPFRQPRKKVIASMTR